MWVPNYLSTKIIHYQTKSDTDKFQHQTKSGTKLKSQLINIKVVKKFEIKEIVQKLNFLLPPPPQKKENTHTNIY